jgi:hypothetical protein
LRRCRNERLRPVYGNLNWHTFPRFAIDLKLVINVFCPGVIALRQHVTGIELANRATSPFTRRKETVLHSLIEHQLNVGDTGCGTGVGLGDFGVLV